MDAFHDIIYSNEWAMPVKFQYRWNHIISSGSASTPGMGIWDKYYKISVIVIALTALVTNVGNTAVSCGMLSTATPAMSAQVSSENSQGYTLLFYLMSVLER